MTDLASTPDVAVRLSVDESAEDRDWDTFLQTAPGGHHVQTSMWARVKATMGWTPVRVIARRNGQTVGGAQILTRPIGRLGRIGYVSNGPVASDPAVVEALLDRVERVARDLHIHILTLQAPVPTEGLAPVAPRPYHLPGATGVSPPATSVIDLDADVDTLLARMQRKTRYNVRLSAKRDIVVRSGTRSDLALYHEMVEATAERRNFGAFPLRYYEAMWEALHPGGHLRLAVAEQGGDPLAAQLAIGFGTTVVNKLSVWSGREGRARPNEAIQWSAIQWAQEQGYQIYDLEGIDLAAARLLMAGEPLPASFDQTTTSFKLGFGGRTVIAPPAHEYLHNRATRWAYGELYPRVGRHRVVKRVRKRLRTASS